MINNQNKCNEALNKIALFLIMWLLLFYLLSIIVIEEDALPNYGIVFGILCTGLLFCTIAFFSKYLKTDLVAVIVLFSFSVGMLTIWNHYVQAYPVSDYKVLWDGAKQIVDGSFHERALRKDDYFCFYNFQIGYAYYLSLLIRLFNGSLVAVRMVEVVIISLTNIVLFKTFRLYLNLRKSVCGVALFMCYPFIFMGSGIINNQHEAMLFEALVIYLFLRYVEEKAKTYVWIIMGALLYLAEFMRPTAFVILIAFVVILVLKSFINRNIKHLLCGIILLVSYFVFSNVINIIFMETQIAPYGLKSSNLWFKISLGLTGEGITRHATTDAEHTNLYYDLKYYGFNYGEYKAAAADYIKDLVRSHSIDLEFLCNKMLTFSGSVDNQHGFIGSSFIVRHPAIINIMNAIGVCIYFLSVLLSCVRCAFKKIMNHNEILLPALIFGGYYSVYLLFETQSRYRYEQYYMLFLMAVPAMVVVWAEMNRLVNKLKTRYGE